MPAGVGRPGGLVTPAPNQFTVRANAPHGALGIIEQPGEDRSTAGQMPPSASPGRGAGGARGSRRVGLTHRPLDFSNRARGSV